MEIDLARYVRAATLLAAMLCLPVQAAIDAPAPAGGMLIGFDFEHAKLVSHAVRKGEMSAQTEAAIRSLGATPGIVKKLKLKDAQALTAFHQGLPNNPRLKEAAALVDEELNHKNGGKYAPLRDEVTRQLRQYVPPQFAGRLKLYFIFATHSGGFAFSEDPTSVYVNLARFSTASTQELSEVVAHELFHAVQNSVMAAPPGGPDGGTVKAPGGVWTNRLLYHLFQEGTAELFTHPLGERAESAHSRAGKARIARNMRRMDHIVNLFETIGLRLANGPARDEVFYDRQYVLMFYGDFDEMAYDLGWIMANAIEKKDGKAAIYGMFKQPPKRFVLRYQELAEQDATLPKFSDEFIRMVKTLQQ